MQYFTTYYSLLFPLVTLITSFFSDRYASRGVVAVPVYMLAVVGFAMYLGNVLSLQCRLLVPDVPT